MSAGGGEPALIWVHDSGPRLAEEDVVYPPELMKQHPFRRLLVVREVVGTLALSDLLHKNAVLPAC